MAEVGAAAAGVLLLPMALRLLLWTPRGGLLLPTALLPMALRLLLRTPTGGLLLRTPTGGLLLPTALLPTALLPMALLPTALAVRTGGLQKRLAPRCLQPCPQHPPGSSENAMRSQALRSPRRSRAPSLKTT